MNSQKDDDIQKLFDQQLFRAFAAPGESPLPPDFSKKVTGTIRAREHRKQNRKALLSTALLLTCCFLSVYGIFVLLDSIYSTSFAAFLARCKWIFLLGTAGLYLIQYADQQLVINRRGRLNSLPPL
jgi:hypothetical protein